MAARTITDPDHQAEALTAITGALAAVGHHDQADRAAEEAAAVARTITWPASERERVRWPVG